MTLPLVTKTLDELPAAVQEMYDKQEDGTFKLRVAGLEEERKSYKQKVDEFRENNIKLRKAQEDLDKKIRDYEERYKDVDPDDYRKIKEQSQLQKDKELIDKGKIDELIGEHTKRMKADYENQVIALQKQVESGKGKFVELMDALKREKIDNQVQLYVNKLGIPIAGGAMFDVINRARQVFSMDDDFNAVALDTNGGKIPGRDGITPLTIEEWSKSLPTDYPYYFQVSEGMNSIGSRSSHSGTDLSKIKDPRQRVSMFRNSQKKVG